MTYIYKTDLCLVPAESENRSTDVRKYPQIFPVCVGSFQRDINNCALQRGEYNRPQPSTITVRCTKACQSEICQICICSGNYDKVLVPASISFSSLYRYTMPVTAYTPALRFCLGQVLTPQVFVATSIFIVKFVLFAFNDANLNMYIYIIQVGVASNFTW